MREEQVRTALGWGGALVGLAALTVSLERYSRGQQTGPILVTVEAEQEIGPISPYIYGMAALNETVIRELRLPLWRWGGNPNTRYNWEKGNCWNAARDWEFRNGNYDNKEPEDRRPSGVFDQGMEKARKGGTAALLTIPTMGWVARNDDNGTGSVGVPNSGGDPVAPGSEAIAGYDPTENRRRVSVRSILRKGRPFEDPPDLRDDRVYQDEWVYHLTRRFGKAAQGGVRFYAMDNEPDLWASTHTDMHPVRPDYEEIRDRFLEGAKAVKDVDPTAKVAGPVSWGWTGYLFSPRDQGADNYATHADRKRHGGMEFLPWFLKEAAAHDRKSGRRTLDILDVHFYPQGDGVYGGRSDPKTDALRLRSTRALWDPAYRDESWIGTPVQLLPRLRQWVDRYYPGTKIALNEWNWGADKTLNGGLAVAEVLGILGREQVYMACYWVAPEPGTPGYYAYKMFRNADDAGHGFGEIATEARSEAPNRVSVFSSLDAQTRLPVVLLINKRPDASAPVRLVLNTKRTVRAARIFRYEGGNLKEIEALPDIQVSNGQARLELPPYSLTLLRCR